MIYFITSLSIPLLVNVPVYSSLELVIYQEGFHHHNKPIAAFMVLLQSALVFSLYFFFRAKNKLETTQIATTFKNPLARRMGVFALLAPSILVVLPMFWHLPQGMIALQKQSYLLENFFHQCLGSLLLGLMVINRVNYCEDLARTRRCFLPGVVPVGCSARVCVL